MARWLAAVTFGLSLLISLATAHDAAAQKAFNRPDLAADAQRLEERLKREVPPLPRPAAALVREAETALGRGNARAALPLANAAALAEPGNAAAWRAMARAALAMPPVNYAERYDLQQRAVAAGYLAYLRATGRPDEAAALAILGEVFTAQENWRPALTVYRLSLDLRDDPALRATYEKLRDERGFRLVGNKVDADAASPRACFEFSEPLARGRIDFAPYVAMTGGQGRADFAVTAEERQLCVDGLRHGERYGFVIRQGVPSVIPGEVLTRNADYEVYVRDRTPSVRFSGRTYVLPRTGQQGIPVVSVNTPRLDISVLRIGDRNLINSVHSSDFMTQLGGWSVREIETDKGRKIWSGQMDVASELNRDVTTAFPVLEAVGRLEPGVYVMVAAPAASGAAIRADEADIDYDTKATQWFVVSDLGLTSFSGPDGVHVLVRSLESAQPLLDVEMRLIARNNEILATGRTDASGHLRFEAGIARGSGGAAPGLLVATRGEDYGFLDLKQAAFDLTDRGVKGRVAPAGLDAFLYAERGVYRSGETVFLSALLRDARGAAVTGLPLTLVVRRPDGVEYRRRAVEDQGGGGRAFSVPLLAGAQTGTWRVTAYADPKGQPVGETSFLVEDYVPERLELTLSPKNPVLAAGEPAAIDVVARYLYGATGSDLDVGGTTTLRAAAQSAIPGFTGYQVGLTDEPFDAVQGEIEETAKTDAAGKATILATVPAASASRPLEVELVVRVGEPGGRAIARNVTLPIIPRGAAIGVRKGFADGALGAGQIATFDVIMAQGDGTRLARSGVRWTLSRINRSYQWFFQEGRWSYEAIKSTRRITDGEIAVNASEPARIATPVDWGTYRLDVSADGATAAETSVTFTVGFEADATAETPDVLDMALDKQAYGGGETMRVRLSPRFAGQATFAVMSDRVADLRVVDVAAEGTTVELAVDPAWGTGAYLVALAHRPMDVAARRLPGRAIGVSWFGIDARDRRLAVALQTPQLVRPQTTLPIPVAITGLKAGEEAYVTVAAVDIGILNLTRYDAPSASAHYFGQRQLAHDLRDLYGYLIDGMQGTRGAIRSGGDAAPSLDGEKPTQEPLARYSGVVKVGPDGTARVDFDLPAFNGSVRVMAVAWSGSAVGEASADVVVRDPVVAQATLPRFLNIGDQSRFFLQVDNVEGPAGDYLIDIDATGPVLLQADALRRTVSLQRGQKASLVIPVTGAGIGTARFDIRISGQGVEAQQNAAIRIQPAAATIARRIVRPVEGNGGKITLSGDLVADMVPGSATVSVSVAPFASLDVPALLKALDRYPYGCTEQTISRALPLLYVNRLAAMEQLALDQTAEERLAAAMERVLARQAANGSFGLWSIGGEDLWLDAFTTDFLTRARERGIAVPATAFNLALDRLRNQVVNTGDIRSEEASGIAYAIYVLARNGRPVMGDLRYLADNKLGDFTSPLARAQIAAALALLGDRGRAARAYDGALAALQAARDDGRSRADYGSRLRDASAMLALLAEGEADRPLIQRASAVVEEARAATRLASTQENTWMVMAAQALAREAEGLSLTLDGQPLRGALYLTRTGAALEARPIEIGNGGPAAARAAITVAGVPTAPEPALSQGFTLKRTFHTLKGEAVAPAALRQNERYVVVLQAEEAESQFGRLLLADPLPAGLEIENPALTVDGSLEGFDWLGPEASPVHREARDDRYVAAFERGANESKVFSVAYLVRAVTPGRYVHPAAFIEDMYRPDRFGRTAFGIVDVAPAR